MHYTSANVSKCCKTTVRSESRFRHKSVNEVQVLQGITGMQTCCLSATIAFFTSTRIVYLKAEIVRFVSNCFFHYSRVCIPGIKNRLRSYNWSYWNSNSVWQCQHVSHFINTLGAPGLPHTWNIYFVMLFMYIFVKVYDLGNLYCTCLNVYTDMSGAGRVY